MELTERERAVVELFQREEEAYPQPHGMRLASAPGPAPSKKPCATCNATGKIRVLEKRTLHGRQTPSKRWRDRICPRCRGDRFLAATRADIASDEAVDPYTVEHDTLPARIRAFGEQKRKTMTREEMDAELSKLRADEYERQGVIDGRPPEKGGGYGWEQRVARLSSDSVFREFDRARGVLRLRYPDVDPRSLVGVRFIAMEMRGPVPGDEVAERTASIVELAREGLSVSKIARRLNVDRRTVQRRLKAA